MDEGSVFDSDSSLSNDDDSKINYINIKKHLSSAKSLLEGVQFDPYPHKVLTQSKINKILTNKGSCVDPCYINKLEEAMFNHFKLKNEVKQAIHGDGLDSYEQLLRTTLFDRFKGRTPVYQKLGYRNNRYFATEIINLKPGKRVAKPPNQNVWIQGNQQINFSSDFESGNLAKVYKVSQNSYELVLQNDINTRGNNQWFFFKVSGLPKNIPVKFQIVNMIKKESLFNKGMKPTIFSKTRFQKKGIGWVRQGQKVHYFTNNIKRQNCSQSNSYSLSFEYKALYDDDEVYISHSYPYTYSDLNQYMTNLFSQIYSHLSISLDSLGDTLGGNRVDIISITSKSYNKNKKVVWIFARQHPGEITSSFVIQGIINTLLLDNELGKYLRQRTIFKIVPMMNPDGVLYGNSRCELTGVDSNRKWKSPSPSLNPIIYQLKQMITKNKNYPVDMVLDLHSHSKKLGSFFYGNNGMEKQKSRVYPLIVSNNDQRFSFKSSRFSESSKLTARYTLFNILKIPNVFSIESSFYGYEKNNKLIEYFPNDYRDLGRSLLEGYARMINLENTNVGKSKLSFETALKLLEEEKELVEEGDKSSEGSDSEAGADEFEENELVKILPKKLQILKKRRKTLKQAGQAKNVKEQHFIHIEKQPLKTQSKIQIREEKKQKKDSSTFFKKRNSLAPINRKSSIQERHITSVKRQIYSFNPTETANANNNFNKQTNKLANINNQINSNQKRLRTKINSVDNNNQVSILKRMKVNNSINIRLFSELKENVTCTKHCYKN